MIHLSAGIKNSLIVLEHLRNNQQLNDLVDISIGAFTNCREVGLTFTVMGYNDDEGKPIIGSLDDVFTYCVYEHRNTDDIILNGKRGWIHYNGELPYKGETKSEYIESFLWNEHFQCAEELAQLILKSRAEYLKSKKLKTEHV